MGINVLQHINLFGSWKRMASCIGWMNQKELLITLWLQRMWAMVPGDFCSRAFDFCGCSIYPFDPSRRIFKFINIFRGTNGIMEDFSFFIYNGWFVIFGLLEKKTKLFIHSLRPRI